MALDKVKYLKRVIIVSWVTLIVCFLIKIFGGNFFVIMCENERFIAVCEYADKIFFIKCLLAGSFSFASNYFYVLALCQKIRYDKVQLTIFIITIFICTPIKLLFPNFGLICDLWIMVVMPIIFMWNNKRGFIRIPIGFALVLIFQVLSMMTKSIELSIMGENALIVSIFSIDVLLMVILYYCYMNLLNKKKEV